LKKHESRLLSRLACVDHLAPALASNKEDLLACTRAAGAALVQNRECTLLGQTPPAEEMLQLAEWLHSTRAADDVFATEALQNDYSDAKSYASIASGVLAISLSRVQSSYLLWFRPEVAQTVRWAGELTGAQQEGKAGAINPHRSFNVWQQEVRGKSLPWDSIEVETASNLRNGILNFVLRIAEERAALSAGLERLQARLRILDKSKSEFLNLISHELRTPLNGLLGIGDLLLGDLKEGPKENEFREMFEQSRRRILSIIDDALLLTEIEVEAERFASKPVALQQVLRTALDRTADFAGSSGVNFELERSHPGSVLAEESLLIKAIQSLLETTVKFSKTGEAVQLKFKSEGEGVSLILETCGNPIPAAALSRFFELFSVGQPVTVRGDDLGLSAAVAYRIISLFDGSISIENRESSGVRITVSLKNAKGVPGGIGPSTK
jgi:chemotaxis family two-component system sensor kinase Cph1